MSTDKVVDLEKPQPAEIIGVDVGTMNIVKAKKSGNSAEFTSIRNMYLPLDKAQMAMAELSNIDYVESDDEIYIIGEDAFNFSTIFGQSVKRPMIRGLISPDEIDGLDVLSLMMKKIVGKTNNGKCMYSVPAPSIDTNNNIIYHEAVFKRIFNELGFQAESFNEAMAIIYSQCQNEQFTGLAFSWGAGQVNVALSYRSVPIVTFSVARSGDWIDEQAAMSVGTIPSRVTVIKERNTDLGNYNVGGKKERRIREAITYYYKEAIRYALDHIQKKLNDAAGSIELPQSMSVIVSGGTSRATGFLPLFKEIIDSYEFPIQIKEVRSADDPMTAVAEGLLIKAVSKWNKK